MIRSFFFLHNNTGKPVLLHVTASPIISYQNLEENYNICTGYKPFGDIISYQNLEENYNNITSGVVLKTIISYQNLEENYNER